MVASSRWPPGPAAHRSRPDYRRDLPRHRHHPAASLSGDAVRPLHRPQKLWCLNPKMACKPLMINTVQIETAEVGIETSKPAKHSMCGSFSPNDGADPIGLREELPTITRC